MSPRKPYHLTRADFGSYYLLCDILSIYNPVLELKPVPEIKVMINLLYVLLYVLRSISNQSLTNVASE